MLVTVPWSLTRSAAAMSSGGLLTAGLCHAMLAAVMMPAGSMGKAMVFRKRSLSLFALGGAVGMAIVWGVAASVSHGGGTFVAALIFAAGDYVLWLLGGHSAVRLGRDGVIVDNLLVRHVIPWGELAEIYVDNGLVFRLRDGQRIGSIMYGGSVLGAVLGYRGTRRVAARMDAARQEMPAGSAAASPESGYRRVLGFSPWPPLLILVIMEAITSLSLQIG